MKSLEQQLRFQALELATRRHFLQNCATGLGAIWLGLQSQAARADFHPKHLADNPLSPLAPPHAAKVKNVIFLHMLGAPSQLELFDYKPDLDLLDGKDCPQSFIEGKRLRSSTARPNAWTSIQVQATWAVGGMGVGANATLGRSRG